MGNQRSWLACGALQFLTQLRSAAVRVERTECLIETMFATDAEFEDEVRRIARLLWPGAQFDGSAMEDGRERDGIFEMPDFVHVIECTVSRGKDKARADAAKVAKLLRQLSVRHQTKFMKGWFITLHEPTAEQRAAIKEIGAKEKLQAAQLVAVSLDQFRAQLVDARSYLDARKAFPFGSVRNPSTDEPAFEPDYIPLEMLTPKGELVSIEDLTLALNGGRAFVVLGDYGAGKSVTMRQLFFALARRFWQNKTLTFPILLNLRDHHGQTDPVEALERHARKVGFRSPADLVKAWRGGYVNLLLDGFDEIAAAGWAGKTKTLRDLRFRSMELVRAFHRESGPGVGIAVSGRAHFFDSESEMRIALGLRAGTPVIGLSEFTEAQVTEYLTRLGWTGGIPAWLPSRPLLLGYLASKHLLAPDGNAGEADDPAAGWDNLLDRIALREAELEAGIDPQTVRALIERVSLLARNSIDGLGPVSPDQIVAAFRDTCGYSPDDRGAVLLQRLPGLGGHNLEDGARVFIDRDFAEAARGSAIARVIDNPFDLNLDTETWQSTLLPLGAAVGAHRVSCAGNPGTKVMAAARRVLETNEANTIAADIVLILTEMGESWKGELIRVREVIVPELRFDDSSVDMSRVEFVNSVIGRLSVASGYPAATQLPSFVSCHFSVVEGRTGIKDLPSNRMPQCEFELFEEAADTTDAIMSMALPLGTKVLLSVLKKLYAQAGQGRKESALFRGLDPRARGMVSKVLELLQRESLVVRSSRGNQVIWMPTRTAGSRRRALSILAAPSASEDILLAMSRDLT